MSQIPCHRPKRKHQISRIEKIIEKFSPVEPIHVEPFNGIDRKLRDAMIKAELDERRKRRELKMAMTSAGSE